MNVRRCLSSASAPNSFFEIVSPNSDQAYVVAKLNPGNQVITAYGKVFGSSPQTISSITFRGLSLLEKD
ncbi:hypothetical protein HK096_005976 [Nowakowskiella sp. JEL0078]|nr:hypothetical protein HK096_005976 [Nowakowskiella sp. JEL0078]